MKYNLSCPMESQISHNIADLFTARPKAYSIKQLTFNNSSFLIMLLTQYDFLTFITCYFK